MLELDFLDRVFSPARAKDAPDHFEVVVIGSGAGGATVARELARNGVNVAILEEGEFLSARDYGTKSPLESVQMLYRSAGTTFTFGNQSVLVPVGKCVGGTTVINSGTALRAMPWAQSAWRDKFGLGDLFDHLPEYYEHLERDLNIVPVPPEIQGGNTKLFRRGAERAGMSGETLTRNERGCRGAGRCFLGCPNDAKQSMNVSFVPDALRAGATLFTQCRVTRILQERNRAAGVEVQFEGRRIIRADAVVVAAGAIYTPQLVRTTRGRRGKGLGAHLKLHPAGRVIGIFDEEVRGWEGVPQAFHLTQYLQEGISIEGIFVPPTVMGPSLPSEAAELEGYMKQYNRMGMLGFRIIEDSVGRVLPKVLGIGRSWPVVWYWMRRNDIQRYTKATALSARILFEAGATRVFTGVHGYEELRSSKDIEALLNARVGASDLELSAYHPQGTCRMTDRPETGVADPDGQVWGVKNLFVADASAMPTTPVSNPQLSIMAFACHVADKIFKRLRKEGVTHTPA